MEFLQPRKVSEHIASSRGFFTVSVFFLALRMAAPGQVRQMQMGFQDDAAHATRPLE